MNKPICFILDHLGVGGVQEYLLNYIRLSTSGRKFIVVSVFSDDIYSERMRAAGADVIFLTSKKFGYLSVLNPICFLAFTRYMFKNRSRFHIVHVKLFSAFAYASAAGQWLFSNVSAGIDCNKNQIPAHIRAVFYIFGRFYARFYMSRTIWDEFGNYGIRPERLRDQPLPVTRRHSNRPRHFPTKYAFLSVGRGVAQKGHSEAITFFETLNSFLDHDATLAIIGDGPAIDELKDQHGQQPEIVFAGSVADYDDWLAGSSGIIRMAWGEGINSVMREALLAGKIVASTIEGPGCASLAREGLIVPIDRQDLAASSRALAAEIEAFSDARARNISEQAERLWPQTDALNIFE